MHAFALTIIDFLAQVFVIGFAIAMSLLILRLVR